MNDSTAASTGRILVVDDNERVREALDAMLVADGFEVLLACDGDKALTLAERERPDLLLLDVMMPDLDGFEVLQRIRGNPRIAEMPVVMVTALDDRASRLRGIESGADDFLTKPINREELRGRVRTIMRLNRYRKLVEQQAALEYQANYDALTGLPNRARLMEELGNEIHAARAFSLIAVGLSGLRDVVETRGHEAADRVLPDIAARLRSLFQAGDTLARTGSDELAILVREVHTPTSLQLLVQRLQTALSRPLALDGGDIYVNGNLGISLHPQDGADASTLLKHASLALHRASQAGWYAYNFFSQQLDEAAALRVGLQADLRRAVKEQVLHVVYQPQVDAHAGRLVGVEALVRWQDAQRGFVSPGEFIPVAEHTGLIRDIGQFVLRSACAQLLAWQRQGLDGVSVSVNVSVLELRDPGFVGAVASALAETGVDPARLELEITESALAPDEQDGGALILQRLQQLKQLGLRLALDDFGTGYSSLRYLKVFPIDKLKIDRSFLMHLPADSDDLALTRAVIALARSFNLSVIAEGVETPEQRDLLLAEGCRLIQGFLYSRPLPADGLPAFAAALGAASGAADDVRRA